MQFTRRHCLNLLGGSLLSLPLVSRLLGEEPLPKSPLSGVAMPWVPQCRLGTVLTIKAEFTNTSGQEQVVYHHGTPDNLPYRVFALAIYDEHGKFLGFADSRGGGSEWGDDERSYAKIAPDAVFKTTVSEMLYSVRQKEELVRLVPGKYQVEVLVKNQFIRDREQSNEVLLRTNRVEIEFLPAPRVEVLPTGSIKVLGIEE